MKQTLFVSLYIVTKRTCWINLIITVRVHEVLLPPGAFNSQMNNSCTPCVPMSFPWIPLHGFFFNSFCCAEIFLEIPQPRHPPPSKNSWSFPNISPAFWLVSGSKPKITFSDDSQHTTLLVLLQPTDNCLGGQTFRSKVTSYSDFRNFRVWTCNSLCLGRVWGVALMWWLVQDSWRF